jgi:hypothetical protein
MQNQGLKGIAGKSGSKLDKGVRIGEWTLMSPAIKVGRDYKVDCVCSCGKRKQVSAISLRAGHSRHCGCLADGESDNGTQTPGDPYQHSPEVLQELALISHGFMPLADQFRSGDGAPTWGLASLACMLGISRDELMDFLRQRGPRFSPGIKNERVA